MRDQRGGNRGVLIKQIAEGLMETIRRRRWSYSQPGRQITVKNSHVNGGSVSSLKINFSRRGARKMKMSKKIALLYPLA